MECPGFHLTGFQASAPCRIVSDLDALQSAAYALMRLQTETGGQLSLEEVPDPTGALGRRGSGGWIWSSLVWQSGYFWSAFVVYT